MIALRPHHEIDGRRAPDDLRAFGLRDAARNRDRDAAPIAGGLLLHHAQAAEFYRVFLSSLQGMQWVPQALVIGPQGVLDVVNMTGKLLEKFAGLDQVGAQVHLQWVIYFPWVPDQGKFKGEVIYSIRPL